MNKSVLLLLFTFALFTAFGQNIGKHQKIKPLGFAVVSPTAAQPDFNPVLITLEKPAPGQQLSSKEVAKRKANALFQNPVPSPKSTGINSDTAIRPILIKEMPGNSASGVPNDNSMAVSNGGFLISVINSRIRCINTQADSMVWNQSLSSFTSELGLTNSQYDPRAIYDPVADRFIVVILNGYTFETSRIIVGVSSTNNPSDDWYLYNLPGNPLNNDTWSDYPHVSLSTHDLYVTFNTFFNGSSNNSGYVESTFWQIPLNQLYSGNLTDTEYYYDLEYGGRPLFNHSGVQGGSEPYGPDFYLLNTRNLDAQNDTVFLLHVSDHSQGNPQLSITPVIMDEPYGLPPDGRQPGSQRFNTNDSRVQDAFIENNQIQFVLNTRDFDNNSAGTYHGIITGIDGKPFNYETVGHILSEDSIDYAYASITYTGKSFLENEALISFLFSGDDEFPSFGALFYDNDERYSNKITLFPGNGSVNVLSGSLERWGDYTGAQRVYNEPGAVWATGSFGRSGFSKVTGTRAVLVTSPTIENNPTFPDDLVSDVTLFPNPSAEQFSLEFIMANPEVLTFEVIDITGRYARVLQERFVPQGRHVFTFDTFDLTAGSYVFVITDKDGKQVRRERFVKL
jgi:hypothetical protein